MNYESGKGKLFGIGAGPGDPGLLTVKAIKAIEKCGVIALPQSGAGAAFSIVREYLPGKKLLECNFAMQNDIVRRKEARQAAAAKIMRCLSNGEDVGFVTLGDPATYSTYMYIHGIITDEGYDAEIIPGVTSYAAAAAALGIALCEDGEALTVIPARHGENIDGLLNYPGNKVIMKSGENLSRVIEKLKERGLGDKTKIASRVSTDGQRLFKNIEEYEKSPETGYFTIAIVKQ